MRVLFADAFHEDHLDEVVALGHDCDVLPGLDTDELARAVVGADVLVVRSTRVTADVLAAADRLGLIVRAGAGTNTIDTDAAAARGIYVCNVPGRNAIAVAELAFALIAALDRSIADNVADLREQRWDKRRFSQARGLHGRSLGIVGLGDVGLALAERAAAFGMRVHAVAKPDRDPVTTARAEAVSTTFVEDLTTLAASVDVLSLHVPLNDSTRGMVDADLLGHVRPGTWIINTSRGEVVDEDALLAALDDRDLRAGIDVWCGEPGSSTGTFASALARHPRVYGTHHIGASTDQAQAAIAAEVVDMLAAYERGEVRNCVNLAAQPLGTATLVVRHLDEVGVLSDVLAELKAHDINVEQMDNTVLAGGRAAVATIHTAGELPDGVVDLLSRIDEVLHVRCSTTTS